MTGIEPDSAVAVSHVRIGGRCLGGADDQMLSYYIARYTNVEINWGMACALGALLLTATLVLYGVYRRIGKAELSLG